MLSVHFTKLIKSFSKEKKHNFVNPFGIVYLPFKSVDVFILNGFKCNLKFRWLKVKHK